MGFVMWVRLGAINEETLAEETDEAVAMLTELETELDAVSETKCEYPISILLTKSLLDISLDISCSCREPLTWAWFPCNHPS